MSLSPAGLLTGLTTFLILGLQRCGFRPLEAITTGFAGVIGLCYLVDTIIGKPDFGATGAAILQPRHSGTESVLLASGSLGATVMPHVIYLHTALAQDRVGTKVIARSVGPLLLIGARSDAAHQW